MLKLYCIGLSILLVAIIANAIIIKTSLLSWYDVFLMFNELGSEALRKIKLIDYLWLLIGYPFILSFGYVIGHKFYTLIFT
ncbi:DUF7672 family protein [Microcosmobacter mediterraneus]|uniref:DUF7672 family protein n=1 Tax=Microcosmobacter mediterraneus TaxID=3075607 RepID=UPI003D780667